METEESIAAESEEEQGGGDGRRKVSDKQVIECLNDCYGIVQQAARLIGKRYGVKYTRSGLWRRIHSSPKLTAARNDAEASGIEFAEAGLLAAIKAGKVQAIIFFLQSRSEKYRPRVDVGPVQPPRDEKEILADLRKLGLAPVDEAEPAAPDQTPPEVPDA